MKMKTSNILLISAFALILLGITTFIGYFKTSVADKCIEGTGQVIEKELKTDPYKSIAINSKLEVEITQDTVQKVIIQAEENLIDNFSVVVIDGQLKVSRIYCIKKSKNAIIKISVDTLERLKVETGGKVKTTNTLSGEKLDIDANSGAEVNMELAYNEIFCNLSAGAVATLKGNAGKFQSDNSAGSVLKAAKLITKNCDVSASSGASAEVYASEELIAKSSSGANIRYSGEPLKKNVDANSGGIISKMGN
jgi:hypothetical protein